MREYAFDVTLNSVIRVRAESLEKAKELLETASEEFWVDAVIMDHETGNVRLTAASLIEDHEPNLFEVNDTQENLIWDEGSSFPYKEVANGD